jgi:hypothetical protein
MIHSTPLSYNIDGNTRTSYIAGDMVVMSKICHCGKIMILKDKIINKSHSLYEDQCNHGILSTLDYNNGEKYNRLRDYEGDLS